MREPWRDAKIPPTLLDLRTDADSCWIPLIVAPVSAAENFVRVVLRDVPWDLPLLGPQPGSRRRMTPSSGYSFLFVHGYGDENHHPIALPQYRVVLDSPLG